MAHAAPLHTRATWGQYRRSTCRTGEKQQLKHHKHVRQLTLPYTACPQKATLHPTSDILAHGTNTRFHDNNGTFLPSAHALGVTRCTLGCDFFARRISSPCLRCMTTTPDGQCSLARHAAHTTHTHRIRRCRTTRAVTRLLHTPPAFCTAPGSHFTWFSPLPPPTPTAHPHTALLPLRHAYSPHLPARDILHPCTCTPTLPLDTAPRTVWDFERSRLYHCFAARTVLRILLSV